jgi:antitoxin CptB
LWRCRRGTRELDLILSAFVNDHYHQLNGQERQLFDQLLESTDPELTDWLCLSAQPTDQGMATIVKRILPADLG